MKLKRYAHLALVIPMLALGACDSQPPQTLDQKLAAAKAPEDRKETLRLACLNEAEWPAVIDKVRTSGRHAAYRRMRAKDTPEIREMKTLCRKMDDLTTADAEKLPATKLQAECSAIVAKKKEKQTPGIQDHANRIQRICSEMTRPHSNP